VVRLVVEEEEVEEMVINPRPSLKEG